MIGRCSWGLPFSHRKPKPPHQHGEATAFWAGIDLPVGDSAAYGISVTTVAFRGGFPRFWPLKAAKIPKRYRDSGGSKVAETVVFRRWGYMGFLVYAVPRFPSPVCQAHDKKIFPAKAEIPNRQMRWPGIPVF